MAHPLRDSNFRILFTGRVVDALGDSVSPAALALAIVIATRSSTGLAAVLICGLLPKVALLPLGGVMADRLGPRRVALVAAIVSGLAQLSIGLLLLAGHLDFLLIALAAAAKGAGSAFDTPATLPLVAGTTDEDGRQAAYSLMGIADSATSLAGAGRAAAVHGGCRVGVRAGRRPRDPYDEPSAWQVMVPPVLLTASPSALR